jgi:zinc resistance-associated protein
MKTFLGSAPILVAALLVLLGISGTVTAGQGTEYGRHGWYSGYTGDLSESDIKALNEERKAFFDSTRDLRQDIYSKELELRSELVKKTPDTKKATTLQAQISKLESEFDQKRLAHMLNMRKISPYAGMPGTGMMGSEMMGDDDGDRNFSYGGRFMGPGRGYGMMGRDYGMGSGMMGRGGNDAGRGREWMGGSPGERESSRGPGRMQTPLKEDDARSVVERYLTSTGNPNLKLGKITEREDVFEAQIVTKDNSLVDKLLIDKSTGWMHPANQ